MHVCVRACVCVCVHVRACVCTCLRTRMCVCMRVSVQHSCNAVYLAIKFILSENGESLSDMISENLAGVR